MITYYNAQGIGMCRDYYDIAGAGAYNETNCRNGVDFWAARPEALMIDLWFLDSETSAYSWSVADAATCITAATNVVSWAKNQWSTHHTTTFYHGAYSAAPAGLKGIFNYNVWNDSIDLMASARADNDACGQYVAAQHDWYAPELYYYNTTMDSLCTMIDYICNEYTRLGYTKPLIPLLYTTSGTPYNNHYYMLEYLIHKPEVTGAVCWGVNTGITAPDYYDSYPFMQANLDFINKYGLTKGTPF